LPLSTHFWRKFRGSGHTDKNHRRAVHRSNVAARQSGWEHSDNQDENAPLPG
jgi:hypothetical protein